MLCLRPFVQLRANYDDYSLCCFQTRNIEGNLPGDQAWSSKTAKELRQSILDGSFRYCNWETCPELIGIGKGKKCLHVRESHQFSADELELFHEAVAHPQHVVLNLDRSCNLHCPSCRRKPLVETCNEIIAKKVKIGQELLSYVLPGARSIFFSEVGEPFASPVCRQLLGWLEPDLLGNAEIHILTNATLATPKNWYAIPAHQMIKWVGVSVDGATERVYSRVRLGGNFQTVLWNLHFLSRLLSEGQIRSLVLLMTVSALNWHEMPQMIRLAKSIGVSQVRFLELLPYNEWCLTNAVQHPTHPAHQAFKQLLNSEIFNTSYVALGSLGRFVNAPQSLP